MPSTKVVNVLQDMGSLCFLLTKLNQTNSLNKLAKLNQTATGHGLTVFTTH